MPASAYRRPKRKPRFRGEQGYILVMTGLLIVPLVVFTAFGVDLGAWYAQATKEQRAVDAAALAGVVQLPNTVNAASAAQAALKANGFNVACTQSSSDATSSAPCTYSFPVSQSHQMNVSLWASATRYFSQIVISGESLTRSATAQYDTHIPLGTPSDIFGNDPTATGTPTPAQPNIWASINGPYQSWADGDPFATHCAGTPTGPNRNPATSCGTTATNANYNASGYEWAIQVPSTMAGSTVSVQIYDAEFDPSNSSMPDSWGGTGLGSSWGGFATTYSMYNTTGSDSLNTKTSNLMSGACGAPGGQKTYAYTTTGTAGVTNAWSTICTFTVPVMTGAYDVYPILVTNGTSGVGENEYSLRACKLSGTKCASGSYSLGTQPKVYAINDMSLFSPNTGSSVGQFYLANITSNYAGHTLEISMFDPGDASGSGTMTMSILPPPSGLGTVPTATPTANPSPTGCSYTSKARASATNFPAPLDTTITAGNPCSFVTYNSSSGGKYYDGKWLTIDVTISPTYSCTTDCWWTAYYKGTSTVTASDRTTWVVDVLGNPVHLTS